MKIRPPVLRRAGRRKLPSQQSCRFASRYRTGCWDGPPKSPDPGRKEAVKTWCRFAYCARGSSKIRLPVGSFRPKTVRRFWNHFRQNPCANSILDRMVCIPPDSLSAFLLWKSIQKNLHFALLDKHKGKYSLFQLIRFLRKRWLVSVILRICLFDKGYKFFKCFLFICSST